MQERQLLRRLFYAASDKMPPIMDYPQEIIQARELTLEAGQNVFRQGDQCENYIVVMAGSVKVFARSPGGKEVVLYRISPGEICVLTTSCLLGGQTYPAEAVTESAIKARIIPKNQFEQLLAESAAFRSFVFSSFSQRLTHLVSLVEQIALERVDQRLARYILDHVAQDQTLTTTHQEIALEIGSAREVVSRKLKSFEHQGLLSMQRGHLNLLDRQAMAVLAELE